MMLFTTINTIMRKIPGSRGFPDNMQITEYLMALVVFCAFAFLESEKGHLRVGMFLVVFPKIITRILESLWYLLSSAVLVMLAFGMYRNILSAYRLGSVTQFLRIPEWPFTVIVAVGLVAYALTLVLRMIAVILGTEEEKEQEKA